LFRKENPAARSFRPLSGAQVGRNGWKPNVIGEPPFSVSERPLDHFEIALFFREVTFLAPSLPGCGLWPKGPGPPTRGGGTRIATWENVPLGKEVPPPRNPYLWGFPPSEPLGKRQGVTLVLWNFFFFRPKNPRRPTDAPRWPPLAPCKGRRKGVPPPPLLPCAPGQKWGTSQPSSFFPGPLPRRLGCLGRSKY